MPMPSGRAAWTRARRDFARNIMPITTAPISAIPTETNCVSSATVIEDISIDQPNRCVIRCDMRIKRSVTRFFSVLVLPAVTVAVVSYFGAYAIWGSRGVLALEDAQAQLGIQQAKLAQLQD